MVCVSGTKRLLIYFIQRVCVCVNCYQLPKICLARVCVLVTRRQSTFEVFVFPEILDKVGVYIGLRRELANIVRDIEKRK